MHVVAVINVIDKFSMTYALISNSWEFILSLIKIDPKRVRGLLFAPVKIIGGINVCLMQHIFAHVSIVTGIVILFNVALIYSGSVILFILYLYFGNSGDEGEHLSVMFDLEINRHVFAECPALSQIWHVIVVCSSSSCFRFCNSILTYLIVQWNVKAGPSKYRGKNFIFSSSDHPFMLAALLYFLINVSIFSEIRPENVLIKSFGVVSPLRYCVSLFFNSGIVPVVIRFRLVFSGSRRMSITKGARRESDVVYQSLMVDGCL
ncbi:hypothetical protein AGLY_016321 [Aphis glycines]|uniref:Uncharacterized protein n=1 Tax=Aphis glycines TaxID=307491 RepID=A0A6G0SYC5_APHGL|nr:hypothetical protein AGLY_016321 [Aphis glycines]